MSDPITCNGLHPTSGPGAERVVQLPKLGDELGLAAHPDERAPPDFLESLEDPAQSAELERQQDA